MKTYFDQKQTKLKTETGLIGQRKTRTVLSIRTEYIWEQKANSLRYLHGRNIINTIAHFFEIESKIPQIYEQ